MHGGSGSESEEGGAAAPRQRPRQHLQQLAGSGAAPQAHRHEQRQHRDGRPSADNAQPAQQQQQKDNQQQQQQRHEPGQQQQGRPQSAAGRPADAKGRPAKPLSRLQRLALQKQQEKAEAERAKEAARKAAAEKRSAIEAAQVSAGVVLSQHAEAPPLLFVALYSELSVCAIIMLQTSAFICRAVADSFHGCRLPAEGPQDTEAQFLQEDTKGAAADEVPYRQDPRDVGKEVMRFSSRWRTPWALVH